MKKNIILLLFLGLTMGVFAQRTPLHPLDIPEGSTDLWNILETWEAGTPPPGIDEFNDQFYISRVRPLQRINDGDYQVNPSLDKDRKFCLWTPLDDPTAKWKSIPRYNLEGDNFSMWQYTDIHGNWTAPWFRVTAGISDVAHKNGTTVGAVLSVPWNAYLNPTQFTTDENARKFYRLTEKNADGTFKYTEKLVKLMKYYGINGIGCNSEFRTTPAFMNIWMDFSKDCHKKAKEIGWTFEIHWYDGTNDNGSISFDNGLGTHNDGVFGNYGNNGDGIVTDMLFFNYNWNGTILSNSVSYAESMGRSSYDLYAGFDIQGRALVNSHWQALMNNKISIGFWGAHAQGLIHQSATDNGSSSLAIQNAYLEKQELIFSGGNRNPGLTPPTSTNSTLSNTSLKNFHGLASMLTAKSTIQQVPFVTRFSLGNGMFFNNQGVTTFNNEWYNLSTQDFLPTWRFWITDANDAVTADGLSGLVKANFVFDDAWFGGSCLKLHGQTNFSRVKLFKTKLNVEPSHTLSLTYKVLNGSAPHAKLFIAKQGTLTSYLEVALPEATQGAWKTFTVNLSDLGIAAGDVISMIGVTTENTPADYELLLGELAVRNPAQTFTPIEPSIKKVDLLRGRYNQLDYKFYYASREESGGVKTYNDEVDTWYFEIYFQQKDQPEQLLTATTSWAAYVINAPLDPSGIRQGRFGVRALSPDGIQASPIRWSDYMEIPYNDFLETLVIDKAIVKPGQTFTVSLEDVLQPNPQKWEIVNPLTDEAIASSDNAANITTSINEIGNYDVRVKDANGKQFYVRSFVKITPVETGALPEITSLEASATTAETDQAITLSYTSNDGEGNVSRGLRIEDPNMFMIPAETQTETAFSCALWFKPKIFLHDKQGTNLINKNTIHDSWPENNWGDFWVTIRPKWNTHPTDEISFNLMGWRDHDDPYEPLMTTGHSVTPGVWNHIVVTQDAARNQKIYLNGKLVANAHQVPESKRRETAGYGTINLNAPAHIYIGGGGVYKAGFDGWIDEVQVWNKALSDAEVLQAMHGYAEGSVPPGVTAYFTFENQNSDGSFPNLGSMTNLTGKLQIVENSGGENTSTAGYVDVPQFVNINAPGFPGITGTLPVTTTPTWNLPGSTTVSSEGKQITVVYTSQGTYNAGVTLSNVWGKDEKQLPNSITINASNSIGNFGIDAMSIYPNPFVDFVNMKFEEAGNYMVEMVDMNGSVVSQHDLQVMSGEVINIRVEAPKGIYLARIKKEGVNVATVKLMKK